jgi:AraC-like DNA-binding protein
MVDVSRLIMKSVQPSTQPPSTSDFYDHYCALQQVVGMYGLTLPLATSPLARADYLALSLQVRPLLAEQPRPDTAFQIMGSYIATSRSLAEALQQLAGFVDFSGNPEGLQLIQGENWRLRFTLNRLPIGATAYAAALPACYAAHFLGFLNWLTDAPAMLESATLTGPPPADARYLRERLACPLHWQGAANELVFSRATLAQPQLRDAEDIARFFAHWHNLLIMAPLYSQLLRERVANRLRTILPGSLPGFAQAAQTLGYAPTSFRRQLQREGCSYQQLKDAVRAEQARSDLLHTALSIDEIATRAGFAETSNFHQAFKRWYGVTPASLR